MDRNSLGKLARACAVLIVLGAQPAPAGADPGTGFGVEEIAPGNFVHRGLHVPFDDPRGDDIANIGFIVGEKCVAVIDSGGSLRAGKALLQAIRQVTDLPVCYVINTHVHFDHLLGNLAFKDLRPEFAGHAELSSALAESREFFLEEFGEYLGPDPGPESIIGPDILIEDTLALDLGGREIVLKAWPTAHTYTDLTALDSQTGTLWAGDLLFMERVPALDGSLKGWLAVMESMKEIPARQVVPGHGPASAAWPQALESQKRYLEVLLDETRAAIRQGVFLDEALESVGQGENDHWLLFDHHHRRNVTKAYTELEWE
jgi:quinoprotein relay system zinc metallohydrolase 2